MKKTSFLIAAALSAAPAMADEGMWTLYNLPQAVYAQMQEYGFSVPYDGLYSGDKAIKNAVVNFGDFCSGVVVSPDGLVFTNHHCGFGAINAHSTVEHDYMKNGFYAKSFSEELPNEDLFVSFMVEQKDITERLRQMGIDELKPSEQELFVDSVQNAWSKDVKQKDSALRLEIKPFYEGNKYYATTYRDFRDVRLVFTVPKSMGKFGGETDNWMWPRQTCDFSVFRIYADPKTNGPADYSKDNVPYKPESWAEVSLDGYKDGDYAMTIGYPGSTSRYLSSYGIRERRDARNQPRAQVRGVKQEVMMRHMRQSDAVRIKYETAYAQSSNYWKNSLGMNKCIDSIGLIAQKAAFEQKVARYVDSTGYLKGKLDLGELKRVYDRCFDIIRARTFFSETFYGTNELATRAIKVHNGMEVKGPEKRRKKQYVEFEDNSDKWDEATDKEVFAALLENYREQVPAKYLPGFYTTIVTDFGGDCRKYVDYVWANSVLMKPGEKIYVNKKGFYDDPGVKMGLDITEIMGVLNAPLEGRAGALPLCGQAAHGAGYAQLQRRQLHDAPQLRPCGRVHARRQALGLLHHGPEHSGEDEAGRQPSRLLCRAGDARAYVGQGLWPLCRQDHGRDAALFPHQQRHNGRQQRLADVRRQGQADRSGLRRQLGQPVERHILRLAPGPLHRR